MLPRAVCHGNGQHVEAPAAQLRVPQPRRARRPRLAGVWQRREVGRAVDLDREAPLWPLHQRVYDARPVPNSRAVLHITTVGALPVLVCRIHWHFARTQKGLFRQRTAAS